MSNAHRPTWAPAVGRESKSGSRSFFQQDFSARTKLKFRTPGQGTEDEVVVRDLKAELARAEREAVDKKRKAKGLAPLAPFESEGAASGLLITEGEDEQVVKRRKLLEEAAALDADDSDDDDDEEVESGEKTVDKGKGKAVDEDGNAAGSDSSDSDSDSDDDEDDTAALMAELAKIKQERAEEAARLASEQADSAAQDRDAEIALGNPLLNLQAALGQTPDSPSSRSQASTVNTGFAVKRRWDDDLIFKNQAVGQDDKPKKEFINDILRSEFHRKFMSKFIK
ncbi:hypothetical protein QFC22_004558 [Naganishia vaughanmartiniae]|uniref:Uncharacterized protein n=1 Tax=Naganishia vaughanmartiniae TaxID=1424756 RepID=A0ACC2WZU2_9TREE|nr:hypothetical protein QFC22_004558 [Naganishia vaughanmartiniae]